jgi:phosphoribosylformylglycinamidine synthase PurS subunit
MAPPSRISLTIDGTIARGDRASPTIKSRQGQSGPKFGVHVPCPRCLSGRPPTSSQNPVAQQYQAKIHVTLRPSVLDPAGVAVRSGLEKLGYGGVEGVRIGKYIELTLTAEDLETARAQVDSMCDRLLANPTIENYHIEIA